MCKDEEFVIEGWTAKPCSCITQKRLKRRLRSAMIPEEFENAEFKTYKTDNHPISKFMLENIVQYLKDFPEIQDRLPNSFGFMATFGEQRLRSIRNFEERERQKGLHNNYGLGKTHLTVAAAKHLIRKSNSVLIIRDADFMDDLSTCRGEDSEEFQHMMYSTSKVDVLVWDDLGKAKPSDARKNYYYRIIDDRYRARKPIIFSSNEDESTLADRIGDDAVDRLFGMAKGRVLTVEGPSYRLL